MAVSGQEIRSKLDRLVAGMTGLKHDGRFQEPNLDGTAGDYISFDSWEWPQGVGLYGLVKLWLFTGRDDLSAARRKLVRRPARGGPAEAQRQHHRADARPLGALGEDRRSALEGAARCLGRAA